MYVRSLYIAVLENNCTFRPPAAATINNIWALYTQPLLTHLAAQHLMAKKKLKAQLRLPA